MAKAKGKNAVVDDLDDLELVEEDEPTPAKTKTKAKAKTSAEKPEKAESTGMGASWLAEFVNEELGTEYTAAHIRVILRKMANDGDLEREVGTDRARYSFTGEKDPTVRAVLRRIKSGEADESKKERLAAARSGGKTKAKSEESEESPKAKTTKKRKTTDDDPEDAPAKPVRRKRKSSDEE